MSVYSTIFGGSGGAGSSVVYSTTISIAHGGLDGFGVPGTTNAFSSGVVIFSGSNISLATSTSGNTTSVTASVGKVHFVNSNGFSWSSSTAAGNTSYWIVTA